MKPARNFVVRGEAHVFLEVAAEWFEVAPAWVVQVFELGLLGPGERVGERIAIPVARLERLARVVQFTRHLELDLEVVALFLEGDPLP